MVNPTCWADSFLQEVCHSEVSLIKICPHILILHLNFIFILHLNVLPVSTTRLSSMVPQLPADQPPISSGNWSAEGQYELFSRRTCRIGWMPGPREQQHQPPGKRAEEVGNPNSIKGQRVWWANSCKLVPHFIGPYLIKWLLSPLMIGSKLPLPLLFQFLVDLESCKCWNWFSIGLSKIKVPCHTLVGYFSWAENGTDTCRQGPNVRMSANVCLLMSE